MFLVLRTLMRVLGFARARALGALLGELQFRIAWHTRRRCERDLAQLLGRAPGDAGVHALLRQAYHHNTAAVFEVLAMFDRRLDDATLAARCRLCGIEHLHAVLAGGRGAILLGTHSGNGLLIAVQLAHLGVPVSVVYRQALMMDEDLFEQGFALYGIEGILANEGLKAYGRMLGALKKNRVVFLMMDQGVKKSEDGVLMRFLGKDMPMPAGPAQLARHARAPVLPVATVAADPAWVFEIGAAVPRAPGATLEADTQQLLRLTEQQVLQHPQFWSWHHRRWRKFPLAPS